MWEKFQTENVIVNRFLKIFISFLLLVFSTQKIIAEEFPKECFSENRSCFHILFASNDLLAFHLTKNKVYHQKRNVSQFKLNGQVINQSHSKVTSKPLKWSFAKRKLFLESNFAKVEINFRENSTIYLNGKVLGQLTYDYRNLEQNINARISEIRREEEKRKKEAEVARKVGLFSKAFGDSDENDRKQIQLILFDLGYYSGKIDGLWGWGTATAIKSFISKYDAGEKLSLPNNSNEANYVLNKVLNYNSDRKTYLIAEEKSREQLRVNRELAAKQERERIEKEAKELEKFCEASSKEDYWKRFEFLTDKPINLLGVDMSMSKKEVEKVLSCKKYRCQDAISIWGVSNTVCKNGNSEITISTSQISFNCSSVNVCGLSADEVAQALINAGKVFYMEPSVDYFEDVQILKYCDRGKAGDILCVSENDLSKIFGGGASIHIEKGNLGKSKPKFD